MADKSIDQLIAAENILATDLFVLQQSGMAKKLLGQVLLNWLTAAADGHGGIQSYELLKTEGLVKTYRFTLADQTPIDIDVVDGRGVESVKHTSTDGLVVTYTITYNDGNTDTITVTNGAKGDKGDNAYVWIKYASQQPTASSHSFGDIPDAWIGIYSGILAEPPTDWQQYKWFEIKGEKGDTGSPATLVSSQVSYQVGSDGSTLPSGGWSAAVPVVPQGKYLWTRVIQTFNSGNPVIFYSVSRMGMDGLGSVVSVCGISPDAAGNVVITAKNVNALDIKGGVMEGPISMAGNKITGLPMPEGDDHAVSKIFADSSYDARPIRAEGLTILPTDFSQMQTEDAEELKLVAHGYTYRAAVSVAGAMADMFPYITLSLMDVEDGGADIANQFRCYDGGFYVYSKAAPAAEITVLAAEIRRQYAAVPVYTGYSTLSLNNDAASSAQVVIDGVSYGVSNATVEGNDGKYDYTVL